MAIAKTKDHQTACTPFYFYLQEEKAFQSPTPMADAFARTSELWTAQIEMRTKDQIVTQSDQIERAINASINRHEVQEVITAYHPGRTRFGDSCPKNDM